MVCVQSAYVLNPVRRVANCLYLFFLHEHNSGACVAKYHQFWLLNEIQVRRLFHCCNPSMRPKPQWFLYSQSIGQVTLKILFLQNQISLKHISFNFENKTTVKPPGSFLDAVRRGNKGRYINLFIYVVCATPDKIHPEFNSRHIQQQTIICYLWVTGVMYSCKCVKDQAASKYILGQSLGIVMLDFDLERKPTVQLDTAFNGC